LVPGSVSTAVGGQRQQPLRCWHCGGRPPTGILDRGHAAQM